MEHKYNECRKRNEQQLLIIRNLESQIKNANQQLKQKQEAIITLKAKNIEYKQSIFHHSYFQQRLALVQGKPLPVAKPNAFGTKRDLTEILTVTPTKICKKVEELLRIQLNQGEPISSERLSSIEQLVRRLPDLNDEQSFHELNQNLLDSLHAINSKLMLHKHSQVDIDKKKEQHIREFISYRQDKVEGLKRTKLALEEECTELEKALVQRARELYTDSNVQSTVTKTLIIKAATHQIKTELQAMKNQTDNLLTQIQSIKSQDMQDIKKDMSTIEDTFRTKLKVSSLMDTNNAFREELREKKLKLKEETQKERLQYIERIDAVKSKIKTNKLIHEIEHISNELLKAKDAMSPFTCISTVQLLKKIMESIYTINDLEKDSIVDICCDIRKTLEALLDKWGTSLSKQDVPVLTDIPENHDGIDNVIQSINAIRLYFQEEELTYIKEQEQKLNSLFQSTDTIENETVHTENALEERHLISKIGGTFTVKDKTFCEWLEELEQ